MAIVRGGRLIMGRVGLTVGVWLGTILAAGVAQMRGPNLHPVWAPSGSAIAYETMADGDSEIVVLDLATGTQHQLTRNVASDGTPVWIGDTIFFRSDRDGSMRWYRMNASGTGQQPSADGPSPESRSSDGRVCVTEGQWERTLALFRCDANGSRARLTSDRHAEQPAVSPDGRFVLFEVRDAHPAGIYMMNVDGSQRHRLADGTSPTWSPDGRVALFKSLNARGAWEITVYDIHAGTKRQLGPGVHPAFSADGRRILFMSDRREGNQIWLMNADGLDARCLTCAAR
jgi:Tol biopolymer transport system component